MSLLLDLNPGRVCGGGLEGLGLALPLARVGLGLLVEGLVVGLGRPLGVGALLLAGLGPAVLLHHGGFSFLWPCDPPGPPFVLAGRCTDMKEAPCGASFDMKKAARGRLGWFAPACAGLDAQPRLDE